MRGTHTKLLKNLTEYIKGVARSRFLTHFRFSHVWQLSLMLKLILMVFLLCQLFTTPTLTGPVSEASAFHPLAMAAMERRNAVLSQAFLWSMA